MPIYEVHVTEEVQYVVPVEYDGDFDEDRICEEAEELLIRTADRDKWCTAVDHRSGEFIGLKEA